jgi:hypothetical protein
MPARAALLVFFMAMATAEAAPRPPKLVSVLVVGRVRHLTHAPWTDAPSETTAHAAADLAVVGVALEGGHRVYLVDPSVDPLVVHGKPVHARDRRRWPDVETRWYKVEPYAWRQGGVPAANGADTAYYTNVVSGGAEHGKWLGYDTVTYFETPLAPAARGPASRHRVADAVPTRAEDDVYGGLGTMRFKVVVDGVASPGAEAVDRYGILPSVHRVSIRRDDTTVGWLTSFFLVPEVFGSAGPGKNHQTERFVGADCADVLVGARRRQGGARVDYTSVAGLPSFATPVAATFELDEHGALVAGDRATGVRAGDIVRIDYAGAYAGMTARSWDHVALVYEDRSDPAGPSAGAADGILDAFDLVVHMGHPRLVVEPLAAQLPAKLDVLRWR